MLKHNRLSSRPAILAAIGFVLLAFCPDARAIINAENQDRWTKPTKKDAPDKEVPGFLVNLGPTGARAVLTEKTFIVRYIFADSPASGRLKVGDVIVGVSGKPFSSHTFGYGGSKGPHGYEGPIMDMGLGIEKAEAGDGKLVLNVKRGDKNIDVTVPLEPIGAFGPTFPIRCKKSDLLRARALKYLADHPDVREGKYSSHVRMAVTLAFLSSDEPRYQSIGKAMAVKWSHDEPNEKTWSWHLSHQLITLGEYYLQTGDASVLPMMKHTIGLLEGGMYAEPVVHWAPEKHKQPFEQIDAAQQLYDGGYGHACYTPGRPLGGYGPMQITTALAVAARQLAARCGVRINKDRLKRSMDFIHRGTNEVGYVAYGGEFTLNRGPVDAVQWKKKTRSLNYVGRVGCVTVAHRLSPEFPKSSEYIRLYSSQMKRAFKSMPDGHGDASIAILWTLMGAGASGDPGVVRAVFDYHKAYFNMMRCHDGSFVLQPGRDYADKGYYLASRYHPTANMVLALGLSNPRLRIQGVVGKAVAKGAPAKLSKPKGKASAAAKPLKVYILVGQSNMEGQARIETFDYIGDDPKTAPLLKQMRGPDGKPRVCERVWISYLTGSPDRGTLGEGFGKLTAGYGSRGNPKEDGGKIGPEFTFGLTMEKAYDGPILIIKTAWGGKSLNTDFRPPSAGPYALRKKTKELWAKHPQGAHGIPKAEDRPKWHAEKAAKTGVYYRLMIEHVKEVLADPKRVVPDYDAKAGYEIAGFVWFQGWNDMCDGLTYPDGDRSADGFKHYTELMAHFIRDVRRDLSTPGMPFVIGVIGVHGDKATGRIANLRPAMAAPADMNEFKGNVAAVHTGQFWDHEMAAMEPRLPDLDRLRQSAHVIAGDGTMEKREPGTPDWQPVGRPVPEKRVWRYTTFDPQNQKDKMQDKRERKRFRDVALPAGLEGWVKPGFDDGQWKSGRAPIGKGVWPYPRNTRDVTVRNVSDWGDGEFILMRTTFEVDNLDYEKFRLSILSRQGFHVYLNGHEIHTYVWWKDAPFYRSILLDPKHVAHLKKGVNVLAAYSNVHYGKTAQPYASIDLAIEGLPADAVEYVNSAEYMRKRMDTVFTRREQQLLSGASNAAYHYMGSGKMMAQIGRAFAEGILEMQKK
jgi:hypothetical protein